MVAFQCSTGVELPACTKCQAAGRLQCVQTFEKLAFLRSQNLTSDNFAQENVQRIPEKSHTRCKNKQKTCKN